MRAEAIAVMLLNATTDEDKMLALSMAYELGYNQALENYDIHEIVIEEDDNV